MIVGFALSLIGFAAHAAIDVSDVVTSITTDGTAAAVAVGGAILAFLGVVLLYKLIRRIF
jgi:hypothetical protein